MNHGMHPRALLSRLVTEWHTLQRVAGPAATLVSVSTATVVLGFLLCR